MPTVTLPPFKKISTYKQKNLSSPTKTHNIITNTTKMNTIENYFAMEDFVNCKKINFLIFPDFFKLVPGNPLEITNCSKNPTPPASSPPSADVSPVFTNDDGDFELFFKESSLFQDEFQDPLPEPSPPQTTLSPASSIESCFSPISPFSPAAPGFFDFGAAMIVPPMMINTDKYSLPQQSSVVANHFDPNILAVPALGIVSPPPPDNDSSIQEKNSSSTSVSSCASPTKPKSKAGRKRKARPNCPAELERQLDIKRAKNTEAARRSRERRMARQAEEAKEWVEMQKRFEAKIESMEKTLEVYRKKMMDAGLEIPE